jgi:hypothetical protein
LRRAPPSRDLAATALALAAEAAAALIADDADGGNSGFAIVGSASLADNDDSDESKEESEEDSEEDSKEESK